MGRLFNRQQGSASQARPMTEEYTDSESSSKDGKPTRPQHHLDANKRPGLHSRHFSDNYIRAEQILTDESVYDYYSKDLLPAIVASLPILFHRMGNDAKEYLYQSAHYLWDFVLPAWIKEENGLGADLSARTAALGDVWERALMMAPPTAAVQSSSIAEFLVQNFDINSDGHISAKELLNMTEIMNKLQHQMLATRSSTPLTFWTWFSREWPLMDWKIGVFLWRTFGGILVVLFVLCIIPGRLHSWSGKILRWPILLLTYFIIAVELMVYVVIRLIIKVAEFLVATPKHRALRQNMAQARSYETWYKYAAALDISQKRDKWQRSVNDPTSTYRYNWSLIRQLMEDMRSARAKNDILLAEAVLQQCTRKNVGGIMSEDLFSYTNTGEPKYIVKEFIGEVTKTLHWITDESLSLTRDTNIDETRAKASYQRNLQRKCRNERDKLWKSVVSWATLSFGDDESPFDPLTPNPSHEVEAKRIRLSSEHTTGSDRSQGSDGVPLTLPHYHREQLTVFLKRARAAYGRTALCLSGGAMMGLYHFGHLQGLMETDCLPNIVSGTSAGSAIGALICTRTNEELKRDLRAELIQPRMKCFARPWADRIRSLIKNGHLFCGDEWFTMIQWFTCGNLTFEEAYSKTGRTFCITLASTTKKAPPVLLNHVTAGNIVIASAVVASAAVPGFVAPVRLMVKDPDGTIRSAGDETYFDGSIEHDIPVNGLAEQLNCQFFVAAQANPHVVPFFFNPKGGVGSPSRWSSGEQDASWRGGFLLAALEMYLKNDMKAKFRFLHEMEAAVGFTSTMMTQEFVGSITIVPKVQLWDFFTLFSDPTPAMLERCFQVGAVAAYQHASMIRLHYRIADAVDACLEKLGEGDGKNNIQKVKPSRRASFEVPKKISTGFQNIHDIPHCGASMPQVITAALNERLAESDSTSMSDGSND